MGILREPSTGDVWTLLPRQVIGRSHGCQLQLTSKKVSSEHAVVWWDGAWRIKDLGSRNGTVVDGEPLPAGQDRQLGAGTTIQFGDESQSWVVESTQTPVARAVAVDGDAHVQETDGLMALPDDASPEVVLYRRADGRWTAEDDTSARVVSDLETLTAGGCTWRLHLPGQLERTTQALEAGLRIPAVRFRFRPGPDGPALEISGEGPEVHVGPDPCLRPLLELARARDDEDREGWFGRRELAEALSLGARELNGLLQAARRLLAGAGVQNVGALVAHRARAAELRLDVEAVEIEPPAASA